MYIRLKNNRLIYIFTFIILFFYLLAPSFNVLNISSSVIVVVFLMPFAFLKGVSFYITKEMLYIYIFILILGIYSALGENLIYNLQFDNYPFSFFKIAINNIIFIIFSISLFLLFKFRLSFENLLMIIVAVSLLNSILILVSFGESGFRDLLESLLVQKESSNIDYSKGFRLRGLAAAGGFGLAVFNLISSVSLIFLYINNKINLYPTTFILVLILLSQFFLARTGLIIGIVILFFFFMSVLFSKKDKLNLLIIFLMLFLLLTSVYSLFEDEIRPMLPWALELYYNFAEGKGLRTNSSDDLMTMFNVPSDLKRLILGFGFYESAAEYRSDSGYIKTLYSVGVLGILIYAVHSIILFILLPTRHPKYKYYYYILGSIMLIVEVKGPVFYQNYTGRVLILIYVWSFLSYKKNKLII